MSGQETTTGAGVIRCYGASDDLLEFEGAIREEFCNAKGRLAARLVGPDGDSLIVVATYTHAGTWALGVAQADEDSPLPPWQVSLRGGTDDECGYSTTLVIDAPVGTHLAPSVVS